MKRLLAVVVLAAASLVAGPVYFTAHGKTYHTNPQCSGLARSQGHLLEADESVAESHKLHKCTRCDHVKAGSNADWGSPVAVKK